MVGQPVRPLSFLFTNMLTDSLAFLILLVHPTKERTMTVILRKRDYDTTMLDMWSALCDKAVQQKIIPEDIHPDDVDEIEVQVTGAFLK